MNAIIKREFRSYFHDMRGFIFLSVFFLAEGFLVLYYGFLLEMPAISYVLSDLTTVASLLFPLLCHGVISADRRNRTDKVLYSLPLSSFEVVVGKYIALLSIFAIPLVFMAFCPLIYNYFGAVNFGAAYASLLSFFLFGAAVIAIDVFFSSFFEKNALSLIASYAFVVFMYLWQILSLWIEKQEFLDGVLGKVMSFVGIFNRFELFIYNIFDVGAIIYYLSVAAFFVFLTVRSVEKRRLGGDK